MGACGPPTYAGWVDGWGRVAWGVRGLRYLIPKTPILDGWWWGSLGFYLIGGPCIGGVPLGLGSSPAPSGCAAWYVMMS